MGTTLVSGTNNQTVNVVSNGCSPISADIWEINAYEVKSEGLNPSTDVTIQLLSQEAFTNNHKQRLLKV